MYDLELNKKEIDLILMALQDSRERLDRVSSKMRCSYLDLPDNLKFFWRNKEAYEKYTDNAVHKCFKQIDEITELEEKIEKIL